MNFVPGADWSERGAGTNAPGTALALDAELQIRGTEHFSRIVQPWSCTAVPVHDPATGALIGAIDLTGGTQVASPQTLALVRATAVAVENHLALLQLSQPTVEATDDRTADGARRRPAPLAGDRRPRRASDQHVDRPARRHPGPAQPPPRRPERRSPRDAAGRQGPRRGDDPRRDVPAAPRHRRRIHRLAPIPAAVTDRQRLDDVSMRCTPATSTACSRNTPESCFRSRCRPALRGSAQSSARACAARCCASGNLALLRRWLDLPEGRDDRDCWRVLYNHAAPGSVMRAQARGHLAGLDLDLA